MTLTHIAVFALIALVARFIRDRNLSSWLIMFASLLFVFWLQPVSAIRSLEFWLPSLLIAVTVFIWGIVSPKDSLQKRENITAALAAISLVLLVNLLRYLGIQAVARFVNPPEIWKVALFWIIAAGGLWLLKKRPRDRGFQALFALIVLIAVFIMLKYPPLTLKLSEFLRRVNGQVVSLANAGEIAWVGYSYFAFRLMHVLREWQSGREMNTGLREFIIYVTFFPAFTSGPIDRLDHFEKELEQRGNSPAADDLLAGSGRIARGLFYKFILADSLALIAINSSSALQVNRPLWMWVMVYAYAFRLYFDFSGYTDIAIGIARLIGLQLPENFKQPYRAGNVTVFWNRWHITLTQWFRAYYFNPVTRWLRTRKRPIPAAWIILFTQITTMLLIALWHGISLNFLIWGAWNGFGLFIHNRWAEWRKLKTQTGAAQNPFLLKLRQYASVFLTFNFIALGWIWFALPEPVASLAVFKMLFGGL